MKRELIMWPNETDKCYGAIQPTNSLSTMDTMINETQNLVLNALVGYKTFDDNIGSCPYGSYCNASLLLMLRYLGGFCSVVVLVVGHGHYKSMRRL